MKKINPNFKQLISILNDGHYHDGGAIGKRLNITRSAVWKYVKRLESYHLDIQAQKGKGYCLNKPLVMLDEQAILVKLAPPHRSQISLELLETIDSTNQYLKQKQRQKTIALCIAEHQSNGKGRFNRQWHSPFAVNVYLSCRYPFQKEICELAGLSLVVSLATIKTLQQFGITDSLTIKWPNDVLWLQQKISGCLIEITAEANGLCQVIIGIGLNVNLPTHLQQFDQQKWTCVETILGRYQDRNPIAATLINQLLDYLAHFDQQGLAPFMPHWQQYDYLAGKIATLVHNNQTIRGRALGINEFGHLLLQDKSGAVLACSSGETSVQQF